MPTKERYWKYKEKYQKQARVYRQKNKKRLQEYYQKWYAINGRDRAENYREAINEWKKNNPKKVEAHKLVLNAMRAGKIVKPKICTLCAKEKQLSAHHTNYDLPLDVIWLCGSCHKTVHLSE